MKLDQAAACVAIRSQDDQDPFAVTAEVADAKHL